MSPVMWKEAPLSRNQPLPTMDETMHAKSVKSNSNYEASASPLDPSLDPSLEFLLGIPPDLLLHKIWPKSLTSWQFLPTIDKVLIGMPTLRKTKESQAHQFLIIDSHPHTSQVILALGELREILGNTISILTLKCLWFYPWAPLHQPKLNRFWSKIRENKVFIV